MERIDLLRHVSEHFGGDIVIDCEALHGVGRATRVHQHVRYPELCHRIPHIRVKVSSRDVVDDVRVPADHAFVRHRGPECVDRQNRVRILFADARQYRRKTLEFLGGRRHRRSGTCGAASHVDDCRSGPQHFSASRRRFRVGNAAAAVKTVRSGVDNAHNRRARQVEKASACPYRFSHLHNAKLLLFLLL